MTAIDKITETPLAQALSERYLAYALSTIVARSLPDVRDGLKPVHRRLLFAMRQLKLDPASGFKKCARVVGDVIGKYHPHGDVAVYDTLVRLAQEFAVRYPLVEGQGNFGNIDGDNAAAMRYTEARLTGIAQALMEGLDEDAVDFRSTYDGEEHEPVVLPAAFPNLLANGASGIAVGMATNIPPHNAGELCDALLYLIKRPDADMAALVGLVPGPDFPTGGVLVESKEAILEAYRTGRGSFRLRARWGVEKLSHGLYQIVVTEIPYQVQKAKVIERIAELLAERKLSLLADIRDESSDTVRIVLEPRNRTVAPEHVMEQLFRQTDLETRFSLNMNVLDGGFTPRVMNLREVLQAFLDHRHTVLVRRSLHRLEKIARRLELLDGFLIAYLNLDEVIRIVRVEDEPKPVLMATFALTDLQAEAILNMRLRSLRRLEEMEIRTEHGKLSLEQAELKELLASEPGRWKTISDQIKDIRKHFGPSTPLGRRRTEIGTLATVIEIPDDILIEREPITVVLSEKGWLRAVKGHGDAELKFKDGDALKFAVTASTSDKILLFGNNGRFYTLAADRLPKGRGHGEPARLSIDLPNDADIVALFVHQPGRRLLVVSAAGRGFIVEEDEVVAQTRNGKRILDVGEGDSAKFCLPVSGNAVAVIGENRRLLVFPMEEVPAMSRGRGVSLQRYNGTDGVADIKCFTMAEGLAWRFGTGVRRETDVRPWLARRGHSGRLPPTGFPKTNRFE
ncbi:MAG: DNA topoisomerase IV subunit A [Alphaproteobacteria bacterium]|nr:DNA topoisomerase IV subunit A [Alphaproteobacteria bacterium]